MYKLTRNYKTNPLQKNEFPNPQDLCCLYIEHNLVISEVAKILGTTRNRISYCIKKFKLKKSKQMVQESRSLFWKNSSLEYKQNRSNQIKKGFQNWTVEQRESFKQKVAEQRQNCNEHDKQKRIDRFKQTWKNRTEEQKEEHRKKFKATWSQKSEEELNVIYNKFRKSFAATWAKKTDQEKQSYVQKMQETKRRNGTFNTSKKEDQIYNLLISKFSNDVIRQYSSVDYPFACDFYIKSKDLYIEINFNWTHGQHPFNCNSVEDQNTLQLWTKKAMTSDFYKVAINVWTVRDIQKLQAAKQNKLNYLCFYNIQEFRNWFDNMN